MATIMCICVLPRVRTCPGSYCNYQHHAFVLPRKHSGPPFLYIASASNDLPQSKGTAQRAQAPLRNAAL